MQYPLNEPADIVQELTCLVDQLYADDSLDVKKVDEHIRAISSVYGVQVPSGAPTIARLADEKLKRTLWWHSGYQRALIDMTTHKEINYEDV